MSLHLLDVEIRVAAPILTRSSAMGRFGVDAPVLRKGGDLEGVPILPASHLTGKLRQAWEELRDLGEMDFRDALSWLGREGFPAQSDPDADEGARKRLTFGDFEATETGDPAGRRIRVSIDPKTGAAAPGALQIMETPFPTGKDVVFAGVARFLGSEDEARILERRLRQGLNWIGQFGGGRTFGFGRNHGARITRRAPALARALPARDAVGRGRLAYVLRFCDPFCLTEHTAAGTWRNNVFVSVDYVAGGVIKGALANMLPTSGMEGAISQEDFDAMRFTHARPVKTDGGASPNPLTRPMAVPQSLAVDRQGTFYDAARLERASLLNEAAPAFPIDWKDKDWNKAAELMGDVGVRRELRLHTAIDREKLRAEENKLFGYEMVRPEGRAWCGYVDLSRIEGEQSRQAVAQALEHLTRDGLPGIGKTGALASFELSDETLVVPTMENRFQALAGISDGALWCVAMQSHALLCGPESFECGEDGKRESLHDAYAEVWAELSGGDLELLRHFAWHGLWGGAFFKKRYFPSGNYRPYVLTNPGSVFILKAARSEEAAAAILRDLQHYGLSLTSGVKKGYGIDASISGSALWKHCPFAPENGWGEIAVNTAVHDDTWTPTAWRELP